MSKPEADARRFTAHVQAVEARLGKPLHEVRTDRDQARSIARDALRDPAIRRFVTRPAPHEMVDQKAAFDPKVRTTTAAERRFNKLLHRLDVPFRKHAGEPKFFTAGSSYELNPLYARLANTLPPHITATGICGATTIRERADRARLGALLSPGGADASAGMAPGAPTFTLSCLEGDGHASVALTLAPDPSQRPLFVHLDSYLPPQKATDTKWVKERLTPLTRGMYRMNLAALARARKRLAALEGRRPPSGRRLVVDAARREAYVVGTGDLASVGCHPKHFDQVYVLDEFPHVRVAHHAPVMVWGHLQDRDDLTDQACTVYSYTFILALARRLQDDPAFGDALLATARRVTADPNAAFDLAHQIKAALVEALPHYYAPDGNPRPPEGVRRFNDQERWRLGSEVIQLLAP
ncbi:MAG TPA: hypothetical protein VFH51_19315 [Myxococcota bacterium]|nr:hypothetical protein [Myxococcota bacterium]